jgi:DNA adenine methylase
MKPPFCRTGNKYPQREEIIKLIPPHKIYVEPFMGSGAIFFSKEKAVKNILNDLDKNQINKLKLLKQASSDLSKFRKDLNTLPKIKEFFLHHHNTIEDLLFYEKIKSCNGFNSIPLTKVSQIYKDGNPYYTFKNIDEYKKKLKGVILLSQDYQKVIEKYDSPDTFFFIDPPYENTKKCFKYAEDITFDFKRLKNVLDKIKGKFLLTINDSTYIQNLFKGYNIKKKLVENFINNSTRKELYIMNY